MSVGDLVRHTIDGACGIVIEDQEEEDGIYRVIFTNGVDDYCDNKDVEVISENR
tara:strand:- start:1586 stop:1747 length:162 start_codon:yes stop_codon:yes gene_type:complete